MLRIGMVGMGGISQAHTTAWASVPEAKFICVCDIRKEKADAAAEVTGGKAYLDFDEMLANEQFDILDICLPTYLHADFAVKALNKGIHVLTEKPISLKRDDITRVYEAAEKNGKNFMVAQVLRFWPEFEKLKEAYDTGKYGKLLSGFMSRLGHTPKESWDGWMRDKARSGFVPFDLHIHDLDFMIYAFGKPVNTVCHRSTKDAADYFNVVYEYPDFFISSEAAWFSGDYRFQTSFRFMFEKAVMEYKGGKLMIYPCEGGEEEFVAEESKDENGYQLPKTNAYYNEIRYFVDCVLAGVPCEKVKPDELDAVLEQIGILDRQ